MKRKPIDQPALTIAAFTRYKSAIDREPFQSQHTDVLAYAAERAHFEKRKLQRILALAEGLPGKTIEQKRERWKRKIAKFASAEVRFLRLQEELRKNQIEVQLPGNV